MFKLTGTVTGPDGISHDVVHNDLSSWHAQVWLERMKRHGYTADLTATVTTGAGSVTYKIIVE